MEAHDFFGGEDGGGIGPSLVDDALFAFEGVGGGKGLGTLLEWFGDGDDEEDFGTLFDGVSSKEEPFRVALEDCLEDFLEDFIESLGGDSFLCAFFEDFEDGTFEEELFTETLFRETLP